MPRASKRDFPVTEVRRYLEPGPIVLITSAWQQQRNVMTLGWHTVLEFTPSLVATMISPGNHSFELVRRSRQCVINLPTVDQLDAVVRIGNCSGADTDKFDAFGLDTTAATDVDAPLLSACHASFECQLHDARQIRPYGLFIWEVVRAHVAPVPKRPRTVHYQGDGQFMCAGPTVSRRRLFKPEML